MSRRPSIQLIGSRLRRMRARKTLAAAIIGLGVTALAEPSPRLVWNASASAPVGLYRVAAAAPARGDLVLVRALSRSPVSPPSAAICPAACRW
ncbi:hypothetical protein [Mesorhizobium sp. BHbdii]